MTRQHEPTRPLSDRERDVLTTLLTQDFPGAATLRAQVPFAVVAGGCDCGCPTIDLAVPGDVPLAAVTSRTPVDASVEGLEGGGLIVFVDDGRLSSLELYSSEDVPPREFPAVDRIRFVTQPR